MWVGRGDRVLSSLPYASILYPEFRQTLCSHCYALPPVPGLTCQLCHLPNYCTSGCQESASASHLLECGLPEPSCPTTGLLLLRVWLRWSGEWQGDRVEEGVPGRQGARRFSHFLSHEADLRASPKAMENVAKYYDILSEVLEEDMPKFDQFLQLYGKVIINDFELSQAGSRESIGMGVYLAPSIVDHSCCPTAWVEFEGNRLVMRSKADLDKPDMDKVTISYLDTREPRASVRKDYLQRHYFFTCACLRCKDESK